MICSSFFPPRSRLSCLLSRTSWPALILPRILPAHASFISRTFAALPEPRASFTRERGVTGAAVFGTVVLFAGTIAAEMVWSAICTDSEVGKATSSGNIETDSAGWSR